MPSLRVHNFTISVDGFAAGPDQDEEHPLGVGGDRLHEWLVATSMFDADRQPAADDVDERYATRWNEGIGATIMGRNMFGPVRGPWPDESWTGWWGEEPPYHHPTFVLTHHPRDPVEMAGGTTFFFVADGIHAALDRALEAAEGQDVCLGGGASTIQQYLRAGLVDRMHIAIAPILLGSGARLFDGVPADLGYVCTRLETSPSVVHATFERPAADEAPNG